MNPRDHPKQHDYKQQNVNILEKVWNIKNGIVIENNLRKVENSILFETNFNSERINTLFSNLNSLTLWELFKLRKDYISVGYSIDNINLHLQKIYAFPVYLTILTIFATVLMLNVPINKPKIFYLLIGIFLSVLIFSN